MKILPLTNDDVVGGAAGGAWVAGDAEAVGAATGQILATLDKAVWVAEAVGAATGQILATLDTAAAAASAGSTQAKL